MAICDPVNLSPGNPPAASVTPSCPDTPHATIGLCLADGTPIAVTTISTCAGAVSSTGWINLINGAWTAGNVPAGTSSCGAARDIELAGGLCDVLNGNVVGYGWVQLVYPQNGGAPAISLINPLNGSPYVPQGVMTPCPAKAVTTAPVCGTVLGGPVETLHAHYGWVGGSNPSQAFFTRPGSTVIISGDDVIVLPCPEFDQGEPNVRIVCVVTGVTKTSYFVRDVGTVDNSTGAPTYSNYEYSSDGLTWVLGSTTPLTGVSSPGACALSSLEVQPICYVVAGDTFPRPGWSLVVHDTNGTVTHTNYQADLTTQLAVGDTVVACVQPHERSAVLDSSDWCVENPVGVFTGWVRRESRIVDAVGAVVSTTVDWSSDGVTFVTTTPTGVRTLGRCATSPPAEFDQSAPNIRVVCSNNGGVLTSYFVRDIGTVNNLTGLPTLTDYAYSSDGTTWVLGSVTPIPGTVTAAPCASPTVEVQPICYMTGVTPTGPFPGWSLIVHNVDGTTTVTNYHDDLVTVFSGTDVLATCVPALEIDRIGLPVTDWCVENPAGVFVGWKQRISQVISNADGSVLSEIAEWSNGGAWVGAAPAGTIRAGECTADISARIGSPTDAAWTGTGNSTLIAAEKAISLVLGTTADAAWSGTGAATIDSILKSAAGVGLGGVTYKANAGGAGYSNSDVIFQFSRQTGTQTPVSVWWNATTKAWIPTPTFSQIDPFTPSSTDPLAARHYTQVFQLDPGIAGAAVAAVKARPLAGVGPIAGVAGTTAAIPSGFRSASFAWLRETAVDAIVTIDGIQYKAGPGFVHATTLPQWEAGPGRAYDEAISVSVGAGAFIQIIVERVG